jgi:Cof subfamily protein (haloacid dehalogenase superfamily)
MIKLIATDVDGTLVPEGTADINTEIFEVIARLHEKGIQIAVSSGRHWSSVEWLFRPVASKLFYVTDNGAYVGIHGRTLFVNNTRRAYTDELIRLVRGDEELAIVASDENGYAIEKKDETLISLLTEGYHTKCRVVDDLTKQNDFMKTSVYCPTESSWKRAEKIRTAMQGKLKIERSGEKWLDTNAFGMNKGVGIRLLQNSLSIRPEETMVFGDQGNDIEMLRSAWYSFAVKNAVPRAKEAARFEADEVSRNGVLKILKMLV